MIVAIDGPAGAGKSTVSRRVAEALGFQLVNTGSLYRAVALLALEGAVALDDAPALAAIAAGLEPRFDVVDGEPRVALGTRDVTDALRSPAVSDASSVVSAVPAVRRALLQLQRDIGRSSDVVMEGRDIGTTVFPDADVKVYLTASVAERARRRHLEQLAAGETEPLAEVEASIRERDRRDTTRAMAPLRRAPDATSIDATALSPDAVVERVLELVQAAVRSTEGRATKPT